jgi:hypothetical protein
VGATATELSALDPGDFEMWRAQFGDVTDFDVFSEAELSLGVVPEPTAIALFCLALPILSGRLWPRRRQARRSFASRPSLVFQRQ